MACTKCLAGYYCTSTAQTTCTSGTYCPIQSTSPTACPDGFRCPSNNMAAPTACGLGYYTSSSTTCASCLAGTACPSGHLATKYTCPSGTYSTNTDAYCTAIATGGYAIGGTMTTCTAGQYIDATPSCQNCPAGSYCPDVYTVFPCPAGTYSTGTATVCTMCPAGSKCPNLDGTGIVICSGGYYALPGSTVCTACPIGYYCPKNTVPLVKECNVGYYAPNAGMDDCFICPLGYSCQDKKIATLCPSHYYALAGWGECRPCPGGFKCDPIAVPVLCASGQYSPEGNMACITCPAGNYCPQGASMPSPCPLGKYRGSTGQSTCLSCGAGSSTYVIGATACVPSPAGYYTPNVFAPPIRCPVGKYSAGTVTSCSDCSGGYVCNSGAASTSPADHECPLGFFCYQSLVNGVNRVIIEPCSAGKYGTSTAQSTELSACTNCPAGSYCPLEGTTRPLPCPKGHYCLSSSTTATPCAGGTYNPLIGSSASGACLSCPQGNYCPQSSYEPIACPPGYYCAASSAIYSATFKCAAGTYSSTAPIATQADCYACPKGSYCLAGAVSPTMCPAGTYNSALNSVSAAACVNCAAGKACIKYGNDADDGVPCPPGYYCPAGTSYPNQYPCAAGTYSDANDATTSGTCNACPVGWVCTAGTNKYTNPMTKCQPGYYCLSGTGSPTQYPCVAGTYQPYFGAEDAAACSYACPPGKYCPLASAAPAGDCADGYYCPEGSATATANSCPAGTYSTGTGLKNANECTICPAGYYCAAGSTVAGVTICPIGKYNPSTGKSLATDCLTCTAGHYCPTPGLTAMLDCGYGKYSDAAATVCIICPWTYYCNTPTTTLASITGGAVDCQPGYICPDGVGEYPHESLLCWAGYYCGLRTVDPTPCPPGKYNPYKGAKVIGECITTPAGKYSLRGSVRPTGDCAPGFYCPAGSTRNTMVPCPVGTFRSKANGAVVGDCGPCPAGYFCTIGCSSPRPCPIGLYCGAATTLPVKCPAGLFGASPMLREVAQCTKCWAGRFCSVGGLTLPDGKCDPGYYCIGSSSVPNPVASPTGDLCPAGGVCPAGTISPQPCLPGTYSATTGMKSTAECTACTQGKYCLGEVINGVSGSCLAGYYCPTGAATQKQIAASPGHYTLTAAYAEISCLAGTYTPDYASSTCPKCPAGYYCPAPGNTGVFLDCTAGNYCPEGSSSVTPCPAGTYSPIVRLQSAAECTDCPPGSFCAGGLSTVSGSCFEGYFCSGKDSTDKPATKTCTTGHYCPTGSGIPVPCDAGTFNPNTLSTSSAACGSCTAGSYCGKNGLSAPEAQCDEGYYCSGGDTSPRPTGKRCNVGEKCPKGSSGPTACPAGTYQDSVAQGNCMNCPRGFFCVLGSSSFDTGKDCPTGHYCPEATGVSTAHPCPTGTYNPNTNAFSVDQCIACDPGKYCTGTGLTAVGPDCNAGTYCIGGSSTSAGTQCPIGSYCPVGTSFPIPCSPGKACTSPGMTADGVACTAGYFCTLAATSVTPADATQGGGPCTVGYYCPTGSSAMIPCPAGTYSNAVNNPNLAACTICADGSYCKDTAGTAVTGQCDAGYYCKKAVAALVGYTTARPASQICPKGYYCPLGTADKVACALTDYQDQEGQATCKPCPAGFWCSDVAKSLCTPDTDVASYYCPNGIRASTKCLDGLYNIHRGSSDVADCLICPAGKYCPLNPTGAETKINECAAGRYCPAGSGDNKGQPCGVGYYCPASVASALDCPPGRYCEIGSLTDTDITTRLCTAGYFCKLGATTPTPTDGTTGYQCPIGNYCPTGTLEPVACPPGSYRSTVGAAAVGDCTKCPDAKYCQSRGMTAIGSNCPAGYYCPLGTAQSNKFPCEAGYQCPASSFQQTLCPDGYYQPLPVQSSCIACPARFYCKNLLQADAIAPKICPTGKYCSGTAQPVDCPIGTFSSATGLMAVGECEDCPPGKMCTTTGITSTAGMTSCAAGYYCTRKVSVNPPTDGTTGNTCPKGHYCGTGTISPVPCPPGTLNDNTGSSLSTACTACPARYYCPYRGGYSTLYKIGIDSSFMCAAGYLCLSGSATPTPNDGIIGRKCVVGTYCVVGATAEAPCAAFTYNPYDGQGSCINCPAGRYCATTGLSAFAQCPLGFYCLEGVDKTPCPAGTYNPNVNLDSASECYPCDPGQYCLGGTSAVSGVCDAGYVCPRGAKQSTSAVQFSFATPSAEGLCPPGYYCPAGSKAPTPCAVGTYQDQYGQTSCKSCPAGRYCDVTGISDPSANLCAAGFFCQGGATTKTPKSVAEGGNQCTAGFYCPAGTTVELLCADGTYEPRPGSSACQTCPAGYYCKNGQVVPVACPVYSYCPSGSPQETVCPDGTYSNVGGLQRVDQCRPCKAGQYCTGGMLKGQCSAGYYCDTGASSINQVSKLCPAGFFCLQGCTVPSICPTGKFRVSPGGAAATDCTDCSAGYYCVASVSTPFECPKGHFCPPSSESPTPCPKGFYVSATKRTISTDCIPCPPGYNCSETGVADLNSYKCPVGYYCPDSSKAPVKCPEGTFANVTGFAVLADCLTCLEGFYCLAQTVTPVLCAEGSYCPAGSAKAVDCPAGYYCKFTATDGVTIAKLQSCPAGYYCPAKTIYPIKCENGYYCPAKSGAPIACPSGSMGTHNEYNINLELGCHLCPPGTYSVSIGGVSTSCKVCTPGYVCVSNTSTATPVDPDKDGGYECPKGYYCPEGSYAPTPCPQGYFNYEKKANSSAMCMMCEAGMYGDLKGLGGCKSCGPTSDSEMGSTICACTGKNRVFQKSDGKCVCKQYYTSVLENDQEDSVYDCRPILLDRCASGYLRDSLGKCVSQNDCSAECKGASGHRTAGIGICECSTVQDTNSVCNSTCRSKAVKMYVTISGEIEFENETAVNMTGATGIAGEPSCPKTGSSSNCKLVSVAMSSAGGFSANYGPSSVLVGLARSRRLLSAHISQRLLATTEASTSGITNPAICISAGDTVSFDVKGGSYPVYMKDAMANSNADFDYTSFTNLDTRITNGESITLFMFTFDDAGVYVFADKSDTSQLTVISVMSASQSCPSTDEYIVPITGSNLLKMGVRQNESITLVPNWLFVGCCFIVILILVPGVIVCIAYFHNRAWESKSLASISYSKKSKKGDQQTATVSPLPNKSGAKQATEEGMLTQRHIVDINRQEEEDGEIDPDIFNEIYKQLQEHVAYVKAEFDKKSSQDKANISRVWEQMKLLQQFMKARLKSIAQIFGKNVKYMFSDNKKKSPDRTAEPGKPDDHSNGTINLTGDFAGEADKVMEGEEDPEADKAMLKEAIEARAVEDAQELERLKDEGKERNKEFMNKFVELQSKKLDDFKERVLENSKLTEGDKQLLMKEYEMQLQNMQKQLMLEQAEEQNQLKMRLDARKAKREMLVHQKEMLSRQKEEIKRQTGTLLEQIGERVSSSEKTIDAEIDANVQSEEQKLESRRQEDTEKLRSKFDKILKKTSNPQDRAQVLEEFENANKSLEKIYEDERAGQLTELKNALEKRRKERKEQLLQETKGERDSIIKICQTQLEKIKDDENVIYNKLANVAIEEKVNEAKDAAHPGQAKLEELKLDVLRQKQQEELKLVEQQENERIARLREEEQKEEDKLREENEKRKASTIAQAKRGCEDLSAQRKKLLKELAKPGTVEGQKADLQKELQTVEDGIKKKIEEELQKQEGDFARVLEARKRKRGQREFEVKKGIMQEKAKVEDKYASEASNVRQETREEKFKRTMEELKARMSDEELPIAIEKLIEDKQMEELSELLAAQYKDRAKLVSERMGQLIEEKLMEMHGIKEQLEKEYSRIKEERDAKQISEADYERRMKEVHEREHDQLRNIELAYIQKGNELEQELCKELSGKNEEALLKLRETQLAEKNARLLELAKTNHFARGLLSGDPKNMASEELEEYQKQLETDRNRKAKELEARKQRLQDIALENEGKVKEFNDETQRLLDELAQREKEKMDRKRKEVEEVKKSHESKLRMQEGITETDKQKIMEEYNQELSILMGTMEAEQKRQADRMMSKLEERWSSKEKIKNQRQLQLLMYKKEVADNLDSQIKEMQIKVDTKVEAKDVSKKLALLTAKTDRARSIFYKKRFISGVEMNDELAKMAEGKIDLLQKEEDDFAGTLLDIDFDDLMRKITGMKERVSGFTDGNFAKLMDGFRVINSRLSELRAKALAKH